MINGIDEKSEKRAKELMELHDALLKACGGKFPVPNEIPKAEDEIAIKINIIEGESAWKKKVSPNA